MCGIFGWVMHPAQLTPGNIEAARRATGRLTHRGPDHGGEWLSGSVYMGHRRLSIIDLSDAANQPFSGPSGRYVLSFNGEIYNYLELREELSHSSVSFRTNSDTEVMVAALEQWQDNALGRFDGMFAGALHDRETGRHLLFRDPLGQKPLYYCAYDGGVVYASELRAILGLPGMSWSIDRAAFQRFMMHGYYSREDTPVQGVRKLLPGCALEILGGQTRVISYWDSIPGNMPLALSEADAIDEFETLMRTSCERAMRADVPYGVFLSGGIDSSLVLDFCSELNPDVRCFSVAMGEADFDESAKAELVAGHVGVEDHQIFTMDTDSIHAAIAAVFGSNDEPHGDPGFVNAYFLARESRPHMTVALSGDGGDELFAGYLPFTGLGVARYLKALPGPLLSLVKAATAALPENDRYLGLRFKAMSYLRGFPAIEAVRYPLWLSALDPEDAAALCRGAEDFFDRTGSPGSAFGPVTELLAPVAGHTPLQQLIYYYQKVFLPEFVCLHTDRAAMQSSLEVRSPFLSPDLVSFANRLPDRIKLQAGQSKWLLKKVAEKRGLPSQIRAQKKQGFTFPLARWLKSSLRPVMEDLLRPEEWTADGLVDPDLVERWKIEHVEGRRNNYRVLYNLMCFRAWRRSFPDISC